MQVLGDLICLPAFKNDRLPLPWWHRAPLGLYTQTWCHWWVAHPATRPVGDLIISVLDPDNIENTLRVKTRHPDGPGVLSKGLATVEKKNIALAESVTVDAGSVHEMTVYCEHVNEAEATQFEADLQRKGFVVLAADFYRERPPKHSYKADVRQGWIALSKWREKVLARCNDASAAGRIDFTRAVVSADTNSRLLRFVFPYKGARTIRIQHRDELGVLADLTARLLKHELNVLSMVLRRGGVPPGDAMLVAVCEPKEGHKHLSVFDDVASELGELGLPVVSISMNEGIMARRTVTPASAYTVVATPPEVITEYIAREKERILDARTPVFFSHRFPRTDRSQRLVDAVKESLGEQDCCVLVSEPKSAKSYPDINPLIYPQLSAMLWLARAGVVLVAGSAGSDAIGKSIPHEFGFLQGQRKPILLLVEGDARDRFKDWPTVEGLVAQPVPDGEKALARQDPDSIYSTVRSWCENLRDSQLM